MHGLSGTSAHGLSGTGCSDFREPESLPNIWNHEIYRSLNNANKESSGFLLTAPHLCRNRSASLHDETVSRQPGNLALTHVTLVQRRDRFSDWLRFGTPVAEPIIAFSGQVYSFAAGQVFALVRRASPNGGTALSSLEIVRAVGRGEVYTTLQGVDPGGDLLLIVRGWAKVRAVLQLIGRIEGTGYDPCLVAPDHWRHIGNRLACGLSPRDYTAARHRAWQLRCGVQQ